MKPLAWVLLAAVFYLIIPTLGRTARNGDLNKEARDVIYLITGWLLIGIVASLIIAIVTWGMS